MNIYAKKGDRVIFSHPKAGYYYDQQTASKYLKLGEIYTVELTNVGGFSTRVYLQEFKDISFNSVHFEDVKELWIKTYKNGV